MAGHVPSRPVTSGGRPMTPEQARRLAQQQARQNANRQRTGRGGPPVNAPLPDRGFAREESPIRRAQRERNKPTPQSQQRSIESLTEGLGIKTPNPEDHKGKVETITSSYNLKTGKREGESFLSKVKTFFTEKQRLQQEAMAKVAQVTPQTQKFLDDPGALATEDFRPQDRSRPLIPRQAPLSGLGPLSRPAGAFVNAIDAGADFANRGLRAGLGAFGGPLAVQGFERGSNALIEAQQFNPAGVILDQTIGRVLPEELGPTGLVQGVARGLTQPTRQELLQRKRTGQPTQLVAPGRAAAEFQQLSPTEQIGRSLPIEALLGGAEAGIRGAGRGITQAVPPPVPGQRALPGAVSGPRGPIPQKALPAGVSIGSSREILQPIAALPPGQRPPPVRSGKVVEIQPRKQRAY